MINRVYGTNDALVLGNSETQLVLKQIKPLKRETVRHSLLNCIDYTFEAVVQGEKKAFLMREYYPDTKTKKRIRPDFFNLCDAIIEEVSLKAMRFFLTKVSFKHETETKP